MSAEKKLKHLEMIQAVINRMAGNAFLLKGWTVTLLAGLFVLAEKDANQAYIAVAYFPLVAFWLLDSYFLRLESLYRELYNHVRQLGEDEIDFSMDAGAFNGHAWWRAIFSCSSLGFYLPLAAVILAMRYITR